MSLAVKQVQSTPNPNAMKFIMNGTAAAEPESFFDARDASQHPVASRLFAIEGVQSVLILGNFVTVNKSPQVKWSQLTPKVKRTLTDAFKAYSSPE